MQLDNIDINDLAEDANKLGYTTKDQVINRLMRIIQRNHGYVKRRINTGRGHLSHTETTAEDTVVIGLAIKMLQEGQ